MPKPTVEDFAWTVFDKGEHTCFDDSAYGIAVYSVQDALQTPTAYFSINALKPGSTRLDANVTRFRTYLIEMDDGELKDQMSYIKSLDVPYSTIVFSGGKSLHFLICLDEPLPDKASYDVLGRRIHTVVTRADHKTRNPSRLARFPFHFRKEKGKYQHLLAVEGRKSYSAVDGWLTLHGVPNDPRPPSILPPTIWEGMKLPPRVRTLRFIDQGASMGERNNALYVAAHDLRESGWSMDEAVDLLAEAPLGPDFGSQERRRTIASAYRKNQD